MENYNVNSEWDKFKEKYNIGDSIKGSIELIKPYGLFIDIGGKDVRGFIRVVNITDEFVKYEPKNFNIGDIVEGVIVEFTDNHHQLCLSLKESDFIRYKDQ